MIREMHRAILKNLRNGRSSLIENDAYLGSSKADDICLYEHYQELYGNHAVVLYEGESWILKDNHPRKKAFEIECDGVSTPGQRVNVLRDGCKIIIGKHKIPYLFTADPKAIAEFMTDQSSGNTEKTKKSGENGPTISKYAQEKKNTLYSRVIFGIAALIFAFSYCLINHAAGDKRLAEGNYREAVSAYEKDVLLSESKRTEEILIVAETAFSAQEYEAAMDCFAAAGDAGKERWTDAVNGALAESAAEMATAEGGDFGSSDVHEAFVSLAYPSSIIESDKGVSWENELFVSSLDELYARCGLKPNGKILIMMQKHRYSDQEEPEKLAQEIPIALMRLLPAENFPSGLEEVEYIIFVDYDYKVVGRYTHGTIALREFAKVTVLRAADREALHTSGIVNGSPPPDSVTYSKSAPEWSSGGEPRMGEEIYSAVSWVLERISG